MRYTVEPGLYALGSPESRSPVLVTANYKLSFDRLREALPDRDAWILVLDTRGINVWCAAGKGTFGTQEIVRRVALSGLGRLVTHRQLILPQLAGPGVAAHLVKRWSGFKVIYGPVRAKDLPAFLDQGCKATREMRCKTFALGERAVLIPVELVSATKWAFIIAPIFAFLGGLGGPHGFWTDMISRGVPCAAVLLLGVLAGAVITPLLLPWLPGRAFTVKGLWAGSALGLLFALFAGRDWAAWSGLLESAAWVFLLSAVSAFLAMNFTGASTYTSLSGVRKEMRWAVPMEIFMGVTGVSLWLGVQWAA
jgi:acetyl-CoA decarbonylase/synthase complex subunit gamma